MPEGIIRVSGTGCFSRNLPLRCVGMLLAFYDTSLEQNGTVHYKKLSNFIRSPIFPWHVTSNIRINRGSIEKFVKRYQHDSKLATSSQSPCNARSRGNFHSLT